jgi:Fe2+ transport system protein FeoA
MSETDPAAIPFVQKTEGSRGRHGVHLRVVRAHFTHGTLVCVSCPLNVGCEVAAPCMRLSIAAPLADRRFRARRVRVRRTRVIRPVTRLRPGETGIITSILQTVPERLVKLSSLGVMPGAEVTLVQRSPAVVLKIGETSIALDGEVADAILVESTEERS